MPECIAYEDLRMIVDYMYRGEIDVMESALKVSYIRTYYRVQRKQRTFTAFDVFFIGC